MRQSKMRIMTLIFCLATLICMLQNQMDGRADSTEEASVFRLYPKETSAFAWLLPSVEEAAEKEYECFLPFFGKEEGEQAEEGSEFSVSGEVHILIYHTHTTEAYRMDGTDVYEESGFSRTKNNEQNIVRVGEELKKLLEEKGFRVIHDTTDHEPPKLATAYERSEQTMRYYQEKYPDMDLYIDLHRDAADVEKSKDDVVILDGKRCARIMFVVGKGTKYEDKPDFDANYALAERLTQQLDTYDARFTRDIRIKDGRYNQHISNMCLLIEVGHNANTLQDALNSTYYLAEAIADTVRIVD